MTEKKLADPGEWKFPLPPGEGSSMLSTLIEAMTGNSASLHGIVTIEPTP